MKFCPETKTFVLIFQELEEVSVSNLTNSQQDTSFEIFDGIDIIQF